MIFQMIKYVDDIFFCFFRPYLLIEKGLLGMGCWGCWISWMNWGASDELLGRRISRISRTLDEPKQSETET